VILSLAPASALLSGPMGRRGRDSSTMAAAQFPRTRRSADRRSLRPAAPGRGGLHARHLLWEWGLNGLGADTELLVSELVTNAVKATAGQQQAAIRLQMSSDGASVLVEVWDADPQPPAPKDLTEDGTPDL
jgi:hypothetical protein